MRRVRYKLFRRYVLSPHEQPDILIRNGIDILDAIEWKWLG